MCEKPTADYEIEVFFDGGCPLCRREIAMLQRRDHERRIRFTDIDDPSFSPATLGRSYDELMTAIQARLPDGTWLEGVEVFRRLYAICGFRRLVRLSRWPGVSTALNLAYRIFARNRLRLTGRCSSGQCQVRATPRA
jgi:predicted DCC family thiol-disulfide oxidoreductase YuxK